MSSNITLSSTKSWIARFGNPETGSHILTIIFSKALFLPQTKLQPHLLLYQQWSTRSVPRHLNLICKLKRTAWMMDFSFLESWFDRAVRCFEQKQPTIPSVWFLCPVLVVRTKIEFSFKLEFHSFCLPSSIFLPTWTAIRNHLVVTSTAARAVSFSRQQSIVQRSKIMGSIQLASRG